MDTMAKRAELPCEEISLMDDMRVMGGCVGGGVDAGGYGEGREGVDWGISK